MPALRPFASLHLWLTVALALSGGLGAGCDNESGGGGPAAVEDLGAADGAAPDTGSPPPDGGEADGGAVLDAETDVGLLAPDLAPTPDAAADAGGVGPDPRQAARERSLFANVSFEHADQAGRPVGWTCVYLGEGQAPEPLCEVVEAKAPHGAAYLRIGPEVGVFQDEGEIDPTQHLRFDLFARRAGGVQPSDVYVFGFDGEAAEAEVVSTLYGRSASEEAGWWRIRSGSEPLAGVVSLRLVVYNSSAAEPLEIDDLVVLEEPEGASAEAFVLRAEHSSRLRLQAGAVPAQLWVPLPMDHGVQTPLHIGLRIEPADVVEAVEYRVDELGNLGAVLSFAPDASADGLRVAWTALLLALQVSPAALADFYPPGERPKRWLAATEVVNWEHEGIVDTAERITAGLDDPEQQLAAILGWTAVEIDGGGMPLSQDAAQVYETRDAACTGFANLAAALGRAAGLPTRSVANIPTWGGPLQTHYIDELYLGPELGWRLVEPQGTDCVLDADFTIVLRVTRPEDEGAEAMTYDGGWSSPGVPLFSLVRPLAGAGRMTAGFDAGAFPGCDSCDNQGFHHAVLEGDAQALRAAFEDARGLWQATQASWQASGPDPAEQELRQRFVDAGSLAELEEVLATLRAAR